IPLGVATTIPAPGNGSGWIYLVKRLRAGLVANACRTVHGRASVALAAAPHLRKDRLVIMALLWPTTLGWLRVLCEILVAFCLPGFLVCIFCETEFCAWSSVCLRFISE